MVVVTFKTLAEESHIRLLLDDVEYEVIPVPTVISVTCGIAHRYSDDVFNSVVEPIFVEELSSGELLDTDIHFYIEEEKDKRYSAFTVGGERR